VLWSIQDTIHGVGQVYYIVCFMCVVLSICCVFKAVLDASYWQRFCQGFCEVLKL